MATNNNIFIHNIYYMLTYAFQELKQNNYEKIYGENFDEILDLFAEILHKGIAYQLKQGLRKEYVSWFYIYDGKIVRVDYLVRENQVKF